MGERGAVGEGKEPERFPLTRSHFPFSTGSCPRQPARETNTALASPSYGHTLSLFMDTKQGETRHRLENN